jgi:UDP-N-acetylenolpyruvoylglucosamine reductase
MALAREIREAVRTRFGVTLVPEPTFVGVDWNLACG